MEGLVELKLKLKKEEEGDMDLPVALIVVNGASSIFWHQLPFGNRFFHADPQSDDAVGLERICQL